MVCWTNTALGSWSDLAKVRQDKETEIPGPFSLQELRPFHRWVLVLVDYMSLHNFFLYFCFLCFLYQIWFIDPWFLFPWSGDSRTSWKPMKKNWLLESPSTLWVLTIQTRSRKRFLGLMFWKSWHFFLPGIRGLGHWWEVGTDGADVEVGAWFLDRYMSIWQGNRTSFPENQSVQVFRATVADFFDKSSSEEKTFPGFLGWFLSCCFGPVGRGPGSIRSRVLRTLLCPLEHWRSTRVAVALWKKDSAWELDVWMWVQCSFDMCFKVEFLKICWMLVSVPHLDYCRSELWCRAIRRQLPAPASKQFTQLGMPRFLPGSIGMVLRQNGQGNKTNGEKHG